MRPSSIWHPYTKHSAAQESLPLITSGNGIYLYDDHNNRYFDAISSWWACNLGHNHPELVAAIKNQADKLQHSILGNLSHSCAAELAKQLALLFPSTPRKVLFASDGACAVEAALKVSIQYWNNIGRAEKHRFVSLKNAYHGDTLGTVSVGYLESFHKQFKSTLFPVHQADSPYCAECDKTDDKCNLECFQSMRDIIKTHSKELAAVIVEPLCQGAAGMRIYSPRYLSELAKLCKEHEVLLIADEIAMGFGRTGRMFACEHANIEADIICLGKGLSGGYLPISATVVKESIFDTFRDGAEDHTLYHGHTFAGNPIAAATALATLHVYARENIASQAQKLGDILKQKMDSLSELKSVSNIRCLGMIAALDLPDSNTAQTVCFNLMKKGILMRPLGNVIYLMPPLITPENILRDTITTLKEILAHC